jgi:Ca2+-binding RTX toxin-like protein
VRGLDFGPILGLPSQTANPNDDVTAMHVHNAAPGASGPVVFGQRGPAQDVDDFSAVINPNASTTFKGIWETTDAASTSINAFAAGLGAAAVGASVPLYWNVHTSTFPGGEIRGQWVCIATDGAELVAGTKIDDILPGLAGNDTVRGAKGDDRITGGDGNDILGGGFGIDKLDGGLNNDRLRGDGGADELTGGLGKDKFEYYAVADSVVAARDVIHDFDGALGDRIDLHRVDAILGGADDAFTIVAALTGVAGQATLKYFAGPDVTRFDGDVNGDGVSDLSIMIDGNHTATLGYVL